MANSVENGVVIEQRSEVLRGMEPFVGNLLPTLVPKDNRYWGPSDILPDITAGLDELIEFRKREGRISQAIQTVLIGNTVTEEALPNYSRALQFVAATRDVTGTDSHPWAVAAREWSMQEYLHGEGLMRYLLYSGGVNIGAVDRTVQGLIRNGFNMGIGNPPDPYEFFFYTSLQEDYTKVAHGRVARLAKDNDAKVLTQICGKVAADESRHEMYYTEIAGEVFRQDPDGAVLAFSRLMNSGLIMPTKLIDDGVIKVSERFPRLFLIFGRVADALGVFNTKIYAEEFGRKIEAWGVKNISVSGEAQKAQKSVIELQQGILEEAERRSLEPLRSLPDLSKLSWFQR